MVNILSFEQISTKILEKTPNLVTNNFKMDFLIGRFLFNFGKIRVFAFGSGPPKKCLQKVLEYPKFEIKGCTLHTFPCEYQTQFLCRELVIDICIECKCVESSKFH